jgi:RNA-directed DNA polymerase
VERRSPAVCNVSDHKEGKDEMTKASIDLQDLRRRIYVKAKAETSWKFWGLYVHVCKLETLREAYALAKRNNGAPGSDGVTFEAIEAQGVESFLEQIADELVGRSYAPLPARKQEIPKDGGKVRVLSIPAIRDRVAQGALKLILEPIFEADFQPGRSDIDRNGQLMKRWTVWRERSFSTRRASSTSTCAAISTMSGMIGCWPK